MRKTWIIALFVVTVLISGCTTQITPPNTQVTFNVYLKSYTYVPDTVTIQNGTTVTWINDDTAPHTVTSTTGVFDSGIIKPGKTYSYTFNQTGTFEYKCETDPSMPIRKVIVT